MVARNKKVAIGNNRVMDNCPSNIIVTYTVFTKSPLKERRKILS